MKRTKTFGILNMLVDLWGNKLKYSPEKIMSLLKSTPSIYHFKSTQVKDPRPRVKTKDQGSRFHAIV